MKGAAKRHDWGKRQKKMCSIEEHFLLEKAVIRIDFAHE